MTRDVAGWFTGVAVVAQVELFLVLLLTERLLGPAEAGGLRAVQLLAYQPALVLLAGLSVAAMPLAVRTRSSFAGLVAARRRVAVVVSPVVAVLVGIALLREPLMDVLFPQYADATPLVVPVALMGVASTVAVPPIVVLRALRRGAAVFALQGVRLVTVAGGAAIGTLARGPLGLAWGLAAGAAVAVTVITLVAWRAARAVQET